MTDCLTESWYAVITSTVEGKFYWGGSIHIKGEHKTVRFYNPLTGEWIIVVYCPKCGTDTKLQFGEPAECPKCGNVCYWDKTIEETLEINSGEIQGVRYSLMWEDNHSG